MLHKLKVMAVAGFLAACATPQPPDVQLFVACKAYERALTALVPFQPVLTEGEVETIIGVIRVAGPLCRGGGAAQSDDTVLAAVSSVRKALESLVIVQNQVRPKEPN